MLVSGVILIESDKALEFLFWLSLVGSMAFDLVENYSLKRKALKSLIFVGSP